MSTRSGRRALVATPTTRGAAWAADLRAFAIAAVPSLLSMVGCEDANTAASLAGSSTTEPAAFEVTSGNCTELIAHWQQALAWHERFEMFGWAVALLTLLGGVAGIFLTARVFAPKWPSGGVWQALVTLALSTALMLGGAAALGANLVGGAERIAAARINPAAGASVVVPVGALCTAAQDCRATFGPDDVPGIDQIDADRCSRIEATLAAAADRQDRKSLTIVHMRLARSYGLPAGLLVIVVLVLLVIRSRSRIAH